MDQKYNGIFYGAQATIYAEEREGEAEVRSQNEAKGNPNPLISSVILTH